MMKYYEMVEKETEENFYRPLEIFRQYVADDTEAEKLHKEKMVDPDKYDDYLVDMNHDPDSSKNKSCIKKLFDTDGKVKY